MVEKKSGDFDPLNYETDLAKIVSFLLHQR